MLQFVVTQLVDQNSSPDHVFVVKCSSTFFSVLENRATGNDNSPGYGDWTKTAALIINYITKIADY